MKISCTEQVDNKEINEFIMNFNVMNCEYTVAHNPVIPSILEKTFNYKKHFILWYDKNNLVGYMPSVLIGNKLVSMPHFSYGGIVSKCDIHTETISNNFEIRSFNKLIDNATQTKITSYLPLDKGKDFIFSNLKYNLRRQIRIAEENCIVVKNGKLELLDDFLYIYYKNMRDLGSPPQPRDFFKNFLELWKNGESIIFCAYLDNKPIAACMMLSYNEVIENCWAASISKYNKIYANYLLYWTIISYACEQNYKVFSFGRSTKNAGPHKFKKHWKPIERELYFNKVGNRSVNMKGMGKLIHIYKRIVPTEINCLIGKLITKYVY